MQRQFIFSVVTLMIFRNCIKKTMHITSVYFDISIRKEDGDKESMAAWVISSWNRTPLIIVDNSFII